jgi:hypothetical protein
MITHARAGVPWLVVLAATAPGLAIVGLAFGLGERPWAARLVQGGLLLTAIGSSFLLDEPPAAVVEATPRSPWWWLQARLLGLAAVLAVICGVVATWQWVYPTPQGWLLAVLPAIAAIAVVAAAAVLRRLGRCAPGDVVAAAAVLLLLGALLFGSRWGGVDVLPAPGAASARELIAWGLVLAASGAVLAWAPSGRPSHPAADV